MGDIKGKILISIQSLHKEYMKGMITEMKEPIMGLMTAIIKDELSSVIKNNTNNLKKNNETNDSKDDNGNLSLDEEVEEFDEMNILPENKENDIYTGIISKRAKRIKNNTNQKGYTAKDFDASKQELLMNNHHYITYNLQVR